MIGKIKTWIIIAAVVVAGFLGLQTRWAKRKHARAHKKQQKQEMKEFDERQTVERKEFKATKLEQLRDKLSSFKGVEDAERDFVNDRIDAASGDVAPPRASRR